MSLQGTRATVYCAATAPQGNARLCLVCIYASCIGSLAQPSLHITHAFTCWLRGSNSLGQSSPCSGDMASRRTVDVYVTPGELEDGILAKVCSQCNCTFLPSIIVRACQPFGAPTTPARLGGAVEGSIKHGLSCNRHGMIACAENGMLEAGPGVTAAYCLRQHRGHKVGCVGEPSVRWRLLPGLSTHVCSYAWAVQRVACGGVPAGVAQQCLAAWLQTWLQAYSHT